MEAAGLRMEDVIGDNMRVMCIDPPPVKKNDDNGKKDDEGNEDDNGRY